MPSSLKSLLPALAAMLALTACGSSSGSSVSSQSSAPATPSTPSTGEAAQVVKTTANATLGKVVLVDGQGRTLYSLSGEKSGAFICTSSVCLQVWHPLIAPGGKASGSVGSLGTVTRPDGTVQVTYKGMPLYTFVQDHNSGEVAGQGIKDVGTWSAVTLGTSSSAPAASSSTTPTNTAPPASSSKGSYGY